MWVPSSRLTRRSNDFPEARIKAVHTPYKAGDAVRPTHAMNLSIS